MSDDYVRTENKMSAEGHNLFQRIKEMISQAALLSQAESPLINQIETLDVTNEKELDQLEWDPNKILNSSDKWTEADLKINDHFEYQVASLPLVYFDVLTSYDLSFKLSDQQIVCFDKKDNHLKKISTVKQQVDFDRKQKLMKDIIIKRSYTEIIKEFEEMQREKNKKLKLKNPEEDPIGDEVTVVILSQDKLRVILGTSSGGILVLDLFTFKIKYYFQNATQSRVISLVEKQNFIGVGYQNGQIIIYKRAMVILAFSYYEIKTADGFPIRAIKLSEHSDHMIAIQGVRSEDYQNIHHQDEEDLNENNTLILYNLKEMKEVGKTQLVAFKCQNFELKNYFAFSTECFIIRSPDYCTFRVFQNRNCQLISQGPDNIDVSAIQFIKVMYNTEFLMVVSYNGDPYFFDLQGKEVHDMSLINTPFYLITPYGTNDLKLLSLSDKILLFQFTKKLHCQSILFERTDQCLYFSDEKESFIIQLSQIKPRFTKVVNSMLHSDRNLYFNTYSEQNTMFMDLTDLKSGLIKKTFKQHDPITISHKSDFIICEDMFKKNIVKISLDNYESEIIKESSGQMLILAKRNDLIFYREQDKKTLLYQLSLINIKQKKTIGKLDMQFDEEFSFQLSNDEQTLILLTKDQKLMKIDCKSSKELKILQTISHELGYSTNISFDHNDTHFTCGGDQSNDLKIYNLQTMNVVATIDNHNQPSTVCYSVSPNRIVTKNNDKLIYWRWDGKLELLFQFAQQNQIIKGFNQQLAGLLYNNQVSLWSDELIHEITNSVFNVQPSTIQKQWTIGPVYLVYQLILNHYLAATEQEKIKLLPHILNYVILPYGFTFLQKLVFNTQKVLVKEALKINNLAYIRDINGNSALIYAIKRKDYENIDAILKFLSVNKKYIGGIILKTWILLFQMAPSQLVPFLDQAIVNITDGFQQYGQKIDDNQMNYYELDSQARLIPDMVYQKLCNVDAADVDKQAILFNQSLIRLNFQLGSKESILFAQALDDCPDEKVFKNAIINHVLQQKWLKIKGFANFLLVLQVTFTLNITVHSFSPGNKLYIRILNAQNYFWAVVELIIWVQSGYDLKYNSKLNIWLFFVLNIYSHYTLKSASPIIDDLLPMINWLGWFQLVTQMQQFEMIRTFYCIFLGCVSAIDGFNYFLLLMIFTFATTQDIIGKNKQRREAYGDDRDDYSEDFYKKHNITQNFDQNVEAIWEAFFTTWVCIVKGDFEEDASIVYRIFVLLSTFISNVVLLNLIIAFMSDSYGNVMQTIYEKKNKTLNFMTLRLEKVIFWEKEIGKTGYLIWIDYVKEISAAASNKTMELDEIVEIKTKECLNEFALEQKILFKDLTTQIVQTRQKLTNLITIEQNLLSLQDNKPNSYRKIEQFSSIKNTNIEGNQQINVLLKAYFSQTRDQIDKMNKNLSQKLETQEKQIKEIKNELDITKSQLSDNIQEQFIKNQRESKNIIDKYSFCQQQQVEQLTSQISNLNKQLPFCKNLDEQSKQIYNNSLFNQEKVTGVVSYQMKKLNSQIVQEVKNNIYQQDVQFKGLLENFNNMKTNLLLSVKSVSRDPSPNQSNFQSRFNSQERFRYRSQDSKIHTQEGSPNLMGIQNNSMVLEEQSFWSSDDQDRRNQAIQELPPIFIETEQSSIRSFVKNIQTPAQTPKEPTTHTSFTKIIGTPQNKSMRQPQTPQTNNTVQQMLISSDIFSTQKKQQFEIPQNNKFDQIQAKVDKELTEKFQKNQVSLKEFIKNKFSQIAQQISSQDILKAKDEQLQKQIIQLNEMQYKIMLEVDVIIKNQGGNLQKLMTEQIVEIISQLSSDVLQQIEANESQELKKIRQQRKNKLNDSAFQSKQKKDNMNQTMNTFQIKLLNSQISDKQNSSNTDRQQKDGFQDIKIESKLEKIQAKQRQKSKVEFDSKKDMEKN